MKSELVAVWIFVAMTCGAICGVLLTSKFLMEPEHARLLAARPGQPPCGLISLPYIFLGLILGAPVGGMIGWRVWRTCLRGA